MKKREVATVFCKNRKRREKEKQRKEKKMIERALFIGNVTTH